MSHQNAIASATVSGNWVDAAISHQRARGAKRANNLSRSMNSEAIQQLKIDGAFPAFPNGRDTKGCKPKMDAQKVSNSRADNRWFETGKSAAWYAMTLRVMVETFADF